MATAPVLDTSATETSEKLPWKVVQCPHEWDVTRPEIYAEDRWHPIFKEMREQAPINKVEGSSFGSYWNVTTLKAIQHVEALPDIYSSSFEHGGITLVDDEALDEPIPEDERIVMPMFIAMDRPKHDEQRRVVSPVTGAENLRTFEPIIRARTIDVLESLPLRETFDWVERVSIELTTRMLATLFDFPFEERGKLTRWSDVATAVPGLGVIDSDEQRHEELMGCLAYFTELWNERVKLPVKTDLVSMLAHGEATRNMPPMEYLGNLVLLIVGGNDTTRSTMTASALALHQHPDQYTKLLANPGLIDSMVAETIRWQTPLAHMRRMCKVDTELGGQTIKAGDKVIMWYVSGNRDERFMENPDAYIIDRPDVRRHLSFGFGIHRCMGNRLAELQLRVLWEEILKRFDRVEVVGDPVRTVSSFVHGFTAMPVQLHPL